MRRAVLAVGVAVSASVASAQDPAAQAEPYDLGTAAAVPHVTPTVPPTILSDDTLVRLPWPDLARLLARSRDARHEAPPAPFVLGPARIEGEVAGRHLVLRVAAAVHLPGDDWAQVPLLRSPATLRRATLDGKPAAVHLDGDRMVLVARGRGEHAFAAEIVVPPAVGGDKTDVPFATGMPASWKLVLPGSDARIEPAVRQSTAPSGDRTVLEALTAPADVVHVAWSGARGEVTAARLTAESLTDVVFQEGTANGRAQFVFEIAGGRRDRLAIALPAAIEVLSVETRDLASWSVEPAGAVRRLAVAYRRPQAGRVAVAFAFELPRPVDAVDLPAVFAEDTAEQRGYVAAAAESPLSLAEESVAGGEAIDVKHLPPHWVRGSRVPYAIAYRHAGPGFAARVKVERHAAVALAQATIDAAYFTTVLTEEGREVVKATFLVKNNLRPYLAVSLPKGSELWAAFVSGDAVAPVLESDRVLLPLVKSREAGEGDTLAIHTVTPGWSLSDVALHYYHDASKWRLIQAENAAVLGGDVLTQAGQTLKIPRLSGPDGADLQSAFPVEIVYSRPGDDPGRFGAVDLELPVPDLGVMKVVWTVWLPSRIDPLHFAGNVTQTSYIRYGLWRRLRHWWSSPIAAALPALFAAQARASSGEYLRKRFRIEQEEEHAEVRSHPRVSLPLVGRPYVFKKFLAEGETPRLSAVYLDRRAEAPLRWIVFVFGFALALAGARALGRREAASLGRLPVLAAGYVVFSLAIGHFVLGTHARAVAGVALGAYAMLLVAAASQPVPARLGGRLWTWALRGWNTLAVAALLLAGLGWGTAVFAALAAAATAAATAATMRRRAGQVAAAAAATMLVLAPSAQAQPPDLPPRAEVTVPFGAIRDLLAPSTPRRPPRDHSVVAAEYAATVAGEHVAVEGTVEVEIHGDGWVRIPLVSRRHALARATVDGKPAGVAGLSHRYELLLRGEGRRRIGLAFVAAAEPGAATLELVPGVASALTVRFPSAGLDPEIAGGTDVKVDGAIVRALVPADGRAEVLWSPTPRAATAAVASELRTTARTLQIVSVDEQRVRVYALARFRVQRGATSQFSVRLPEGVELLDVAGEVADREIVTEGDRRLLRITAATTVRDQFELSFAYDWRPGDAGGVLPAFAAVGVRSETGAIGIESAGSTEVQLAGVDGASMVDVRAVPELYALTDKPILHAVRYLSHPYTVRLKFVRHPEAALETATVDEARYTTVVAGDGRAITEGRYTLRNARRSFLGVTLPEGSEVQSVVIRGEPATPVRDAKGTLLLPLVRSAAGANEMQQFDAEVVYLTRLLGLSRSGALPPVLPAVDLRISRVEWALHLPPGTATTRRPRTELASDTMQWATAPRAFFQSPATGRAGGGDAIAAGILPVRFNLPTHGEPESFVLHYLPAGAVPQFEVGYAPRSLPAAAQAAIGLLVLGAIAFGAAAVARARRPAA